MSDADSDQSLQNWLSKNRIKISLSALNTNGIEELSDFSDLTLKEDIAELARDLKLSVVKRKKFIKAVMELNGIENSSAFVPKTNKKSKRKRNQKPLTKPNSRAPDSQSSAPSSSETDDKNDNISGSGIIHVLLKHWGLGQYITSFIDAGFDNVSEWQELTINELTKVLKMKKIHAKNFIKKRKTLVQNKNQPLKQKKRTKKLVKSRSKKKVISDIHLPKNSSDSKEEEAEYINLLKKWKLSHYINIFMEEGYDDIDLWEDLTLNELKNDLQMKSGHAKNFLKQLKSRQTNVSGSVSELSETQKRKIHTNINPYTYADSKCNESPEVNIPIMQQPTVEVIEHNFIYANKESRQEFTDLKGEIIVSTASVRNIKRLHKTIMVIGATGTGKTTLLNSMMNYLYDVEYDDPFRFKLIQEIEKNDGQAESQTDNVTPYILSTPMLNYDVTVIDTPGFGDCRGMAHDKNIIKSIKKCFETEITEIDAVCFVIRAPQSRLTHIQQYIFSQVLGIFGSDIKDNILVLFTFSDGDIPPAVSGLKAAKIPYVKYFKLNNCAFMYSEKKKNTMFDKIYWEMGIAAFEQFFLELNKLQTKSLTMTKQVLDRRQQLEIYIESINPVINDGFDILENIRHQIMIINKCSAEVNANKYFSMEVTKTRRVKKAITGHFTTICGSCQFTCHLKCSLYNDTNKGNCKAMNSRGYCTICPNNCHWTKHNNKSYVWEAEKFTVHRDIRELKDKYLDANSMKSVSEQIIDGMTVDIVKNKQQLNQLINNVRESLNELSKIALRPNIMSQEEYVQKLIDAEKMSKKKGWEKRVISLRGLINKAANIDFQDANYDAYKGYGDVKDYMSNKCKKKNQNYKKENKNANNSWFMW